MFPWRVHQKGYLVRAKNFKFMKPANRSTIQSDRCQFPHGSSLLVKHFPSSCLSREIIANNLSIAYLRHDQFSLDAEQAGQSFKAIEHAVAGEIGQIGRQGKFQRRFGKPHRRARQDPRH